MTTPNPTGYNGPKFELTTFLKGKAAKKGGEVTLGMAAGSIAAYGLAQYGVSIIDGSVCVNPAMLILAALGAIGTPVLSNLWTHRSKIR